MQGVAMGRSMTAMGVAVILGMSVLAFGQATQPSGGLTGTWRWTIESFGGQQETVLTLKQEGNTITGTVTGFGGEASPISDVKFANNTLTFKVVRDFGGQSLTTVYTATINGTTIKGKSETIIPQEFEGKKGS